MAEQATVAQELRRSEELTEQAEALVAEAGGVVEDVRSAEDDLEQAEAEASEAAELAESLESRLDDGDLDVTQGELEAAQGRAGFLSRRLNGHRVRVEAARAAQRERQVADLADEVAVFSDDASLDSLRGWYAQAVLAGSRLRELLVEREQRRVLLTGQVEALDALHLKRGLQQLSEEPLLAALAEEIASGAWPRNPWIRPHVLHDPQVVLEQQELLRAAQERQAARQAEQLAAAEAERVRRLGPGPAVPDEPTYRLRGA